MLAESSTDGLFNVPFCHTSIVCSSQQHASRAELGQACALASFEFHNRFVGKRFIGRTSHVLLSQIVHMLLCSGSMSTVREGRFELA